MTKRNCNLKPVVKQVKGGSKRLTQDGFLAKMRKKHPSLDFSGAHYINAITKVKVICQEHGSFERTPNSLDRGGCPTCGKGRCGQYRKKSFGSFIAEANKVHNNLYEYNELSFSGYGGKVDVFCSKHKWFSQYVTNHLKGFGCLECGGKTKWDTKRFFDKCAEVHNGKFTYPAQEYISMSKKIAVVCPTHGRFEVRAQGHMQGNDCQKCSSVNNFGFSRTDFINSSKKKGKQPLVYVIRCFSLNDDEAFYKIGITCEGVRSRFQKTQWDYGYEAVYEIGGEANYIFDLEKKLHSLLRDTRYLPLTKFNGYTECFTTIKPIEKLLKELSTTEQLQLLA